MSKPSPHALRQHVLWKFFASIKLSIGLLLSLAVTSIIGTLIPQNGEPRMYMELYGKVFYGLFNALNLTDMYHSWWFQALLILLTLNIIICSLDRFRATRKIVFESNPFNLSRFRNPHAEYSFDHAAAPEVLLEKYQKVLKSYMRRSSVKSNDDPFCLYSEKGRYSRLGVYVVHSSIVFLLLGGLLGSLMGFDGFVQIPEGQATDRIQLRGKHEDVELGFKVRCDKFRVSFYKNGTPSEFRSTLSLVEKEGGNVILTKDILVNAPLRYQGINFFQSSYGALPPESATFHFFSQESGMVYEKTLSQEEAYDIPEGLGRFVYHRYVRNQRFGSHAIGETIIGKLTVQDEDPLEVILPIRFHNFDKMRKGRVVVNVADTKKSFYTGLQVTRDPGVGLVYTGFVLLIAGCYVTFFLYHERICIILKPQNNGTRVRIAALTHKNRLGLKLRIEKLGRRCRGLKA